MSKTEQDCAPDMLIPTSGSSSNRKLNKAMCLYITRNGAEERCGRVTTMSATSTSAELYFVSIRYVDGSVHAFQNVERWRVRKD